MNRYLYFSVVLLSILVVLSCEKQTTSNSDIKSSFISFQGSDCLGHTSSLQKTNSNAFRLDSWRYDKGILELTVAFNDLCCPDFEGSMDVDHNVIDLYIINHGPGCYCFCDYEGVFKLEYPPLGETRVRFHLQEPRAPDYTTRVDTLITVK